MRRLQEKELPGYSPKKTGKAYKVFRVKNGKLYPPMVSNPGGQDTPIGVWLGAEEGEFAGLSKTGRKQVKSIGSGTLSYRPGWHLGDIPRASQFDRTNKETGEKEFPKDFIWAECDYVMDVDYQKDSDNQGYMRTRPDGSQYRSDKYQHSLAGLTKLPTDGYYRYRTNPRPETVPWVITGAIKVNKLLGDDEVNSILKKNGVAPIHRQGGDKTVEQILHPNTQNRINKTQQLESIQDLGRNMNATEVVNALYREFKYAEFVDERSLSNDMVGLVYELDENRVPLPQFEEFLKKNRIWYRVNNSSRTNGKVMVLIKAAEDYVVDPYLSDEYQHWDDSEEYRKSHMTYDEAYQKIKSLEEDHNSLKESKSLMEYRDYYDDGEPEDEYPEYWEPGKDTYYYGVFTIKSNRDAKKQRQCSSESEAIKYAKQLHEEEPWVSYPWVVCIVSHTSDEWSKAGYSPAWDGEVIYVPYNGADIQYYAERILKDFDTNRYAQHNGLLNTDPSGWSDWDIQALLNSRVGDLYDWVEKSGEQEQFLGELRKELSRQYGPQKKFPKRESLKKSRQFTGRGKK